MSESKRHAPSRRNALKCLAYGSAGTLFTLSGGVLSSSDLAWSSPENAPRISNRKPLFVQISDTHIGFNKDANPDVNGTLKRTIALVNAMPERPGFILHTGDITHLTKPEEFDMAQQLLSDLRVRELHTVPGEHDTTDGTGAEYFRRFGKPSGDHGYYSFDQNGVHFVALVNVMNFKAGGLGALGEDQTQWLKADLHGRPSSQPLVLFAHMPLWTIYARWGWGTAESDQIVHLVRRFGSVTVLNGHIHQIVQKVEGNIVFHTARSTAYPQPQAGQAEAPGPLKVPPDRLAKMLGATSVSLKPLPSLSDSTLA